MQMTAGQRVINSIFADFSQLSGRLAVLAVNFYLQNCIERWDFYQSLF